jgi:hypothetical protein
MKVAASVLLLCAADHPLELAVNDVEDQGKLLTTARPAPVAPATLEPCW